VADVTEMPKANPGDAAALDAGELLNLITGGWVSQITRAVAELHIPDHLADGAETAEDIAGIESSDPRTTFRLMRAASSIGLLSYLGEHRFGLTGRGHLLRSDVAGSLRAFALIQTANAHWQCSAHFPEAVRQGGSQVQQALGMDLFTYFAQEEKTEEAALFARAMGDLSGLVVRGAVATVDTSDVSTVVDIGGADGDFVLGLMQANPTLGGQVLDLPHAVEGARREADKRGLTESFTAVAGDFFATVPAADLYLLKMILHDWDDQRCVEILRNCRAAVRPGGRALIVERLIGELGRPDFATCVDMIMLSVTQGGMERDLEEYDALFAASGWRRTGTHPIGGGYSLLTVETA
jgi:hypothetical protein